MAGAVQQMMREVMDIRQAAEYLGISGDTLYRYASEGFIPAFKLGNRWRFKRSLLDAWMVRGGAARPPPTSPSCPARRSPPPAPAEHNSVCDQREHHAKLNTHHEVAAAHAGRPSGRT